MIDQFENTPAPTIASTTTATEQSAARPAFAFEETIVCPGCNRPLQMMLQPVHLEIQIRCPRCSRLLTPSIRRAIREHLAITRE